MNKRIINFSIILLLPFLNWCSFISFIWWFMCRYAPDSDHCAQFIAIQTSNPSKCKDIKWTKFKKYWSNPPRDKCYLLIAKNTGNESVCNNIKWWYMSYTKKECIQWAKVTKVKKIDKKLEELNKKIENSVDSSETLKFLREKKKLEEDFKNNFKELPQSEKNNYYIKKKNEILKDVRNKTLKQAIAHSYSIARREAKWDILKELKILKKVKNSEKLSKELDENANKLVDNVKSTLVDMVNNKKEAILDDAKQKLINKVYEKSWKYMKYKLDKLKKLKESYDKSSKYYNELNEKYEKLKNAYEKMKDIQNKLNKIDKLKKEWKLDSWKAKVLKWSILLWEWLEYVTSYVPVFWDTISTVTKETFKTVNEFAKKRAIRTTSINKCIEDPLNCDVEWISWY